MYRTVRKVLPDLPEVAFVKVVKQQQTSTSNLLQTSEVFGKVIDEAACPRLIVLQRR